MMRRLFSGALLMMIGLSLPAAAQIGDKAPKIETKEIFNSKLKSVDELKGKLVLVEFFAHW